MSYEEVQFEEKSVQLIPEDWEILSEYSWDMAGYTPRFGLFYQGNENADIDGLTKWQAEHIFQLTPTPLGMEAPCFTPIGNPEVKEPAVPLQSQPF